jgi:hypothetical protein
VAADIERMHARNIDPARAAVHAEQAPASGASDIAALVATQNAATGAGEALRATSANTTALVAAFIRPAFSTSGADLWRNIVAGNRTGYANERGELRSRAYDANSVAFRCQSNVAGNNTSVHVFEVCLSDDTVLFSVDATGAISGSGGYQTLTDVASLNAQASHGSPHFQSRNEPGAVTRLVGQLTIGAGGITAGSTIATLPAGSRPPAIVAYTFKFTGTGSAAAQWTIDSGGLLTCSANLVSANTVNFDGWTYIHA